MDLDKYIGENIDDILDNPNEFVFDNINNKKPFMVNNKKVSFEVDQKIKSGDKKILNNYNVEHNNSEYNHEYDNSDYYDKIYEDMYDNDNYDDFGYVYKKNDSIDSDDEITDEITDENIESEQNEDDYTEDIIGELYQNMYENKTDKTDKIDIVEIFKNISKTELDKLETHEIYNSNTQSFLNQNQNKNPHEFDDDDGYYFINLINIFMKYYNNKFDKIENFFSGIKEDEKSTSSQMELFYDAIIEYKTVKESFKLDDINCMKLIYLDSDININTETNSEINNDTDKILELFSKCENQIYMLDLGIKRYISPSLLVCLNYIYENKLDSYWDIYNLRNV